MSGMLFYLSVLGWALGLMMISRRLKSGAALMCSVCGMLLVSFWGGIMLEWLIPTAYVLMIGGLVCLVPGVMMAFANRCDLRRRLFTPGLLFYALASAWVMFFTYGQLVQDHDSLSFWARAVKELYTFDLFYIRPGINMYHMDYIPLMASLQYSIERVFGWQDAYMTYVPAVCCITGIAAMSDVLPKKRRGLLVAVLTTLAFGAFGFHFSTLRADGPMLLLFTSAVICLFFKEEEGTFLPVAFAASVLTGFKIYTGLMYAVLLAAGMLCVWLKKRKDRNLLWMLLVSIVLILALQFGWSIKYNASMAAKNGAVASFAQLMSGNPRTGALMDSINPDSIAQFKELAAHTFTVYGQSRLVWVWPFVIAAVALVLIHREKRGAAFAMLGLLLIAAVIYLGGLFASYFVQAETSGAAVNYLSTASAPLLIASVFLAVYLADGIAGYVLIALMAAGMIALNPPVLPEREEPEYTGFAGLAYNYYYDELDGILTEEDFEKRAILIDATYEGTGMSQSGKTHSYQYFALPMRVEEPIYFPYGDYIELDYHFDAEELYERVANSPSELLLLRMEDELYWEAVRDALGLWGDWDEPMGVYDITREDGEVVFTMREW